MTIKKSREYKNVYDNGKSYANKYLVMYIWNNQSDSCRIGISVSKKVGNSVIRHRMTRLVRESWRLNLDKFESGYDIIIIVRAAAKEKNFKEVSSAMLHLGKIHKILKEMINS